MRRINLAEHDVKSVNTVQDAVFTNQRSNWFAELDRSSNSKLQNFLDEGLANVFKEMFPIDNFAGTMELEFVG